MANLGSLILQRNQLQREISDLQNAIAVAQQNSPALVPSLTARLVAVQQQLNSVNIQIEQLEGSTASAGNLVSDDALAKVPGAATVNPEPPPEFVNTEGRIVNANDTPGGSNAIVNTPDQAVDEGTDSPLRPLTFTQGTPAVSQAVLDAQQASNTDVNPPYVQQTIGVGAASDDVASKNLTRVEIDNIFNEQQIIPQSNVLDQYASYTYVASLYLMSAPDYKAMIASKTKTLRGAQLLMQSGGAAVGGRNQFFSNDYYIDRIELKSQISGKGTNAAHNVSTVKMTVVEPNGITLIANLDKAVQTYLGGAEYKKKNYAAQMYLLVIKFYGYDDQGNLVRGGVPKPDGSSDPNAFVEKWYPLQISAVNFKVANKLVEYEIEAVSPRYSVAVGSSRGTIPYNVEVSGVTVNDVLNGPSTYSSITSTGGVDVDDGGVALLPEDAGLGGTTGTINSAPPKASTAPSNKTTIRSGLMSALNEYQRQLVDQGTYTYPDTYSIEFINPSLQEAKIKNKGSTDKRKIGNSTSKNAADQKVGAKQSADTNSKITTITAGSQIVQVIDHVVRNSSFLEDQQLVIFDPVKQKEIPNGVPAQNLAYFKISLEATPTKYDPKRNDYAYDVKYIVHLYRISDSASPYFFVPTYKGVHKQYNYWFTGENNSVLSYEQNYNAQYTQVLSGAISSSPVIALNNGTKFNFSPASNQSSQGADGKVNEPKANFAEYLFNPGDLAECRMNIVGDPAWLQQGEAFAGIKRNDPFYFRSFLADGTINFESQQILFEIAINMPKDYNTSTGLIDPNQQEAVYQPAQQPGTAKQSYVYRAAECVSEFAKGKFTQSLRGTLVQYLPDQSFKANQQIAQDQTAGILRSLSQGRVNNTGSLLGSLTSPAFLNNLPTVGALVTGASNFGINPGGNSLSTVAQNILGASPTRLSTPPINPTSFGLSVGTSVLNTVDVGANPTGTEQPMALDDDSGAGEYVSYFGDEGE